MPFLVGISGATRSGKGTLAQALARHIAGPDCSLQGTSVARRIVSSKATVSYICQDHFFLVDKIYNELGQNWEAPEALDHGAMLATVRSELAAEEVDWIIAEGFMLFHDPELYALFDLTLWLDLSRDIVRRRRMKTKPVPPDYFDELLWPSHEAYRELVFSRADAAHRIVRHDATLPKEELLAASAALLKRAAQSRRLPSSSKEKQEDTGLRVQIASDLHLEHYSSNEHFPSDIIIPTAPVLALLGDIMELSLTARLESFLRQQAERFELVLFVAGNHEYYCPPEASRPEMSVDELKESFREVCERIPRVRWLDRSSLLLSGVRVLGTTLWSHVPKHAEKTLQQSITDYHLIRSRGVSRCAFLSRSGTSRLLPSESSIWHDEELTWLRSEIGLASRRGENCLVLTHHAPSFRGTSNPKHSTTDGRASLVRHAFATDLEDLLGEPVHSWVYGHTHYNNDQAIHGTRLVSNQRGYPHQVAPGYRNDFVVQVPVKSSAVEPTPM
mmetsp:Transcript_30880/g.67615  ORF Transcript_30880/g.67615 Transcript_30880/m.67615 type:complete len:501 (-) Transcript_30880:73-1575(-)